MSSAGEVGATGRSALLVPGTLLVPDRLHPARGGVAIDIETDLAENGGCHTLAVSSEEHATSLFAFLRVRDTALWTTAVGYLQTIGTRSTVIVWRVTFHACAGERHRAVDLVSQGGARLPTRFPDQPPAETLPPVGVNVVVLDGVLLLDSLQSRDGRDVALLQTDADEPAARHWVALCAEDLALLRRRAGELKTTRIETWVEGALHTAARRSVVIAQQAIPHRELPR